MLKPVAKKIVFYLAIILVLPSYLIFKLASLITKERFSFPGFSQFWSLFPGQLGAYLRKAFYSLTLTKCTEQCFIGFGTIFSTTQVEIESGVYIGNYCSIGSCKISEKTMLASRVSIISGVQQHGIKPDAGYYQDQAGEFRQVIIGKNCWIGEGAIVGKDLEDNQIVGAGKVVK